MAQQQQQQQQSWRAHLGVYEWQGAGWWRRRDNQSSWEEWIRQGGWTRGEGFHRVVPRHPNEPHCFLQLEVPFTANHICKEAACPHDSYKQLQERIWVETWCRLRPAIRTCVVVFAFVWVRIYSRTVVVFHTRRLVPPPHLHTPIIIQEGKSVGILRGEVCLQ